MQKLPEKYLRIKAVRDKLGGLDRTSLWRLRQDPDFPPAIAISPGIVVFKESELDLFMDKRRGGKV